MIIFFLTAAGQRPTRTFFNGFPSLCNENPNSLPGLPLPLPPVTTLTNLYPLEDWTICSFPIQMWELDLRKGRVQRNWCFQTVMLERTLEKSLGQEIKRVNSKGNQPWTVIGKTDAQAEAPILWPPDEKNWLIGKDSDAGKDWGQEEKGTTGWDGCMASLI